MDKNTIGMQTPSITPDMIRNSQNISCDCGGMLFSERIIFKRISAILSPSGKEEIVPMPVIVCEVCGKIPSSFDPQNMVPSSLKAKVSSSSLSGGDSTMRVVK